MNSAKEDAAAGRTEAQQEAECAGAYLSVSSSAAKAGAKGDEGLLDASMAMAQNAVVGVLPEPDLSREETILLLTSTGTACTETGHSVNQNQGQSNKGHQGEKKENRAAGTVTSDKKLPINTVKEGERDTADDPELGIPTLRRQPAIQSSPGAYCISGPVPVPMPTPTPIEDTIQVATAQISVPTFSAATRSNTFTLAFAPQHHLPNEHEETVVASPVTDWLQSAEPLGHDEEKQEQTTATRTRRAMKRLRFRRCALASTAALIAIVAVAVAVVLVVIFVPVADNHSRDMHTGDETSSPGLATTTAKNYTESYVQHLLPDYTAEALGDQQSPQSQALHWLLSDPSILDYPDWRLLQRFALATLYHNTGGPNWLHKEHWLSYDVHECEWYTWDLHETTFDMSYYYNATKSICHEGVYTQLRLPRNNVKGSVPLETYLLSSLRTFALHGNKRLQGTISPLIGQLSDLHTISLFGIQLSGTIPSEVGTLQKLTTLVLFSNPGIEGTIPTELGSLSQLQWLILDFNNHSGTIPSELGATSLQGLYLANNELTGEIPSELGLLGAAAESIMLSSNHFRGTIPSEIGLLSNVNHLQVEHNELTGTIPTQLGMVTALVSIHAMDNELTGPLPSELGRLLDLHRLEVSDNDLTSTVPGEVASLSTGALTIFDVSKTQLTGTIPVGLCSINATTFSCSETLCGCDCSC